MLLCCFSAMNDKNIEEMLRMLESGEISDDQLESDGEDLDYYPSRQDLLDELEESPLETFNGNGKDIDPAIDPIDAIDPPAVTDSDPPIVRNISTPESANYMPSGGRSLLWRKRNLVYSEDKIAFSGSEELSSNILELDTPYQFFTYFFTNEFLESIVQESNLYATQQQPNRLETYTVEDLRKYLGIITFMSVYHYPNIRSYWGKFGFGPIRDTMPVNKFEKIRRVLHFNDNSKHLPVDHPDHDKLHKLRPVITHLNEKFSSVTIDQRLSIDEQMCATKIGHFLKQYMPNKPHKWGFKLFALCSLLGYSYNFIIYAGKDKDDERLPSEPEIGVVGQTVMRLLRVVPKQKNHIVYFDNYYTSLPLMYHLATEGIHSLGTIQRNRLGKTCKLPHKQDVMKSSIPRGTYEEYVTNFENVDISAVSWKDNKQVVLASTYVGAEPVETIHRYDKKLKRKIEIACPKLVKEYNAHMGGVDLMDSHLGRYRIRIKSRKWYMRIFYHLLDLTIINAWILYRKVMGQRGKASKDIMNLADFRSELADTLCKYSTPIPRGRPRSTSTTAAGPPPKIRKGKPCQVLPPNDVILDGVGHEQIRTPNRMRCMFPACNLKTVIMCAKCKVHLCAKKSKDCFNDLHKK
ncbi:piggyBac transposable element-derived protein 3-like [Colias croceus]|uniref:piggyBac transposable element-derived protein 3-like n=1 Tax=Colias crocea TaxID=72248 RepID=UPI001E27F3F1|nr:piggyBac transposable element-derived protein 3-like [Colias croceus]